MDVHKSSLLDVFTAKQRLEVPLFQRQYVWSEEQQWLPLWEDIERKFTEALEGRREAPNHFLSAASARTRRTAHNCCSLSTLKCFFAPLHPDRDAVLWIVDNKVLRQQSSKCGMVILYQRLIYYIGNSESTCL
jgi:Protein of unknown function DUF262